MNRKTFILEMKDTQNKSWQGQLEWVQGREKKEFRSVLELLQLIASVMEEDQQTGDE